MYFDLLNFKHTFIYVLMTILWLLIIQLILEPSSIMNGDWYYINRKYYWNVWYIIIRNWTIKSQKLAWTEFNKILSRQVDLFTFFVYLWHSWLSITFSTSVCYFMVNNSFYYKHYSWECVDFSLCYSDNTNITVCILYNSKFSHGH